MRGEKHSWTRPKSARSADATLAYRYVIAAVSAKTRKQPRCYERTTWVSRSTSTPRSARPRRASPRISQGAVEGSILVMAIYIRLRTFSPFGDRPRRSPGIRWKLWDIQ
ncbi:PREDICTED: uncharacterized protein LOC105569651 [Vollenhovia emeryi]|uniref:uncharacterized protein LOC105569651 n=1 Tax=Vollenhovia emeryi TaxID=411798 RepID=UPI0005F53914|nr:PREDICTED: uncharacterized protein LOC105569651 [Vollenhovia emeryi]